MRERLRIAVVSPYAHYAGHHWQITQGLTDALHGKGHEVDVITTAMPIQPPRGATSDLLKTCLPSRWKMPAVWKRNWQASLSHNLETLVCLARVFWRQRRCRYDVWHLIDATHLLLFFAALISPVPIFYHLWGEVKNLEPVPGGSIRQRATLKAKRWLMQRAMRRGRLVMFCETVAMQRWNEAVFGGHVYQVPWAVEVKGRLEPRQVARRKLGIPEESLVLLMFGTHREGKDYDTIIQAAKLAHLPVFLLFAGKTISSNAPDVLLAKHGFSNALVIERFLQNDDVSTVFGACDVVMVPYAEGYTKGSGVIVEAAEFSRLSLATDTGFLRDFIDEYRCGFVYPYGDAGHLAGLLEKIVHLPADQRKELDANITATAQRHSWPSVIEQYLAVYRIYLLPRAKDSAP